MIMHVVLESAEVSSCGLRNISRVAVHCIQRRAGDGRTIYYHDICYSYSTGPGIYGSKPTEYEGAARGQGLFTLP